MNLRTTLRLRFVPFNSIIHLERKPRGTISATKERIQVSILMELRNPWTFGSIASIKRILWKTESLFHLSIRCFETTSLLFFLSTMFRCFAFLSRGLRAEGIPISLRFADRTHERTCTMESGGLTPRWLTIAWNRGSRVISRSYSLSANQVGFERNSTTIDGLTFPIRGRLGFWKTPARSPRAAWSRTWCTSRQDAPGRTGRAFCDSGRSECATGTCTMATWCEVSNNFLRQKRILENMEYWIEEQVSSPNNFSRTNAWRETEKKKKKKLKLETRQLF